MQLAPVPMSSPVSFWLTASYEELSMRDLSHRM